MGQNKELTFIFLGLGTTWEEFAFNYDLAILTPSNIQMQIHQINHTKINHINLFHIFDGFDAKENYTNSKDLKFNLSGSYKEKIQPINICFSETHVRMIGKDLGNKVYKKNDNKINKFGLADCISMYKNAKLAINILKYALNYFDIQKINLIGEFHGASNCILFANMLEKEFSNNQKQLSVNLFLNSPIIEKFKFKSENNPNYIEYNLQNIPSSVKKLCAIYNSESISWLRSLTFQSNATKYCYLPSLENHNFNIYWMSKLVKNFFPEFLNYKTNFILKNNMFTRKDLIESLSNLRGCSKAKETNEKFQQYEKISLLDVYIKKNHPHDFKKAVESYFKYFNSSLSNNKSHSIFSSFKSIFTNKNKQKQIFHSNLFLNVHHEICFSKAYPSIYKNLFSQNYFISQSIENEYNSEVQSLDQQTHLSLKKLNLNFNDIVYTRKILEKNNSTFFNTKSFNSYTNLNIFNLNEINSFFIFETEKKLL